jgi:hypothetical protein
MEYIHKAKAEKTRTKVLSDQMEARRVKNKVSVLTPFVCLPSLISISHFRLPVSVALPVSLRSARELSPLSTRLLRSKHIIPRCIRWNTTAIVVVVPYSLWSCPPRPLLHFIAFSLSRNTSCMLRKLYKLYMLMYAGLCQITSESKGNYDALRVRALHEIKYTSCLIAPFNAFGILDEWL